MTKQLMRLFLVFTLTLSGAAVTNAGESGAAEEAGSLVVDLTGLEGAKGKVFVTLYDSKKEWLGDTPVLSEKVSIEEAWVEEDKVVRTTMVLPHGEYAISVFYDANHNGELDTNWIGIPKEPMGLSNNAKPKFGPPKYADSVFTLGAEPVVQRINIEVIGD